MQLSVYLHLNIMNLNKNVVLSYSLNTRKFSYGFQESCSIIIVSMLYCIALIFRRSKFSRIVALKEFVEKISQICVALGC